MSILLPLDIGALSHQGMQREGNQPISVYREAGNPASLFFVA